MKDLNAEEIATQFMRRISGIPRIGNPSVFLFGSAARNELEEGSDVDLLVILDRVDEGIERGISEISFKMSLGHKVLINEIVLDREKYTSGRFRATPFFENLLREGIPV